MANEIEPGRGLSDTSVISGILPEREDRIRNANGSWSIVAATVCIAVRPGCAKGSKVA